MKMIMKMLSIIALLVMVASCATTSTPVALPEKYNLDAELQAIKRLPMVRAANWEQVDITFTAVGGKKYLVVLDRPLEGMNCLEL